MQTYDNQLLGFLLLLHPYEQSAEPEGEKIQLIKALVGTLSVAIETQYLLQEQKNLMNSFIKLIAGAIDRPYRPGKMLSEALNISPTILSNPASP